MSNKKQLQEVERELLMQMTSYIHKKAASKEGFMGVTKIDQAVFSKLWYITVRLKNEYEEEKTDLNGCCYPLIDKVWFSETGLARVQELKTKGDIQEMLKEAMPNDRKICFRLLGYTLGG